MCAPWWEGGGGGGGGVKEEECALAVCRRFDDGGWGSRLRGACTGYSSVARLSGMSFRPIGIP